MGLEVLPNNRADAKAYGCEFYFTGKPCSRGGISKRKTSSGICLCSLCHVGRLKIKSSSYKRKKETSVKRYLERNKEKLAEEAKAYRDKNKERIAAYLKDYYNNNPERFKGYRRKRKAAEKTTIPKWFGEFDEFVMQQANELTLIRKEETGILWHVDHMIPLQARKACGLHCADNIQVIPAVMNLAKQNKMQLTEKLEWLKL